MNLIKVNNLNLSIHEKEILKGLSFEGKAGEILGIIGESGSGKSMTANSIIKLLPFGSSLTGEIILQNKKSIRNFRRGNVHYKRKRYRFYFPGTYDGFEPLENYW